MLAQSDSSAFAFLAAAALFIGAGVTAALFPEQAYSRTRVWGPRWRPWMNLPIRGTGVALVVLGVVVLLWPASRCEGPPVGPPGSSCSVAIRSLGVVVIV